MRLTTVFLAFVASIILAGPAQAEVITNDMSEVPFDTFIDCANDGAGESAEGTFRLHTLVRETLDESGGIHTGANFQPMGGTLTGDDTGDIYQATGKTGESMNVGAGGLPISTTYVNQFHMVGRGGAVTLTVHNTVHITVDANGNVTAEVDNSWTECD